MAMVNVWVSGYCFGLGAANAILMYVSDGKMGTVSGIVIMMSIGALSLFIGSGKGKWVI